MSDIDEFGTAVHQCASLTLFLIIEDEHFSQIKSHLLFN